jgi:AraC-like DNA-binding protein
MREPAPWSSLCGLDEVVRVYPDGCRDIIWSHVPGERPAWLYSPLDDRCRPVAVTRGQAFFGVRLPPGAELPTNVLADLRVDNPESAGEVVRNAYRVDSLVSEVLALLSDGTSSPATALGTVRTSRRSIQRLLAAKTGRGPLFWSRLARVRQAAQSVLRGQPLAECAADCGFADQAHMTREFTAWFALTPAALRADRDAAAAILTPGYAV